MTKDLITRAQGGDGEAFRELTEPHRRELQVHCYRMLGSFPDVFLEGANTVPLGPEAHYQQTEAITLAFVTALQLLPARQRAVLILREVLGYYANEVADMLDSTIESVNSALKRARSSLRHRLPARGDREPSPAPDSVAERALVAKFVRAWESRDVDALVALLTTDVSVSMPPIPFEYQGHDAVARFCVSILRRRSHDLVPTRANGQPAFGVYLRAPSGGIRHGTGLFVLTLAGDRISAMTRFDDSVLPWFGLPRSLPEQILADSHGGRPSRQRPESSMTPVPSAAGRRMRTNAGRTDNTQAERIRRGRGISADGSAFGTRMGTAAFISGRASQVQ